MESVKLMRSHYDLTALVCAAEKSARKSYLHTRSQGQEMHVLSAAACRTGRWSRQEIQVGKEGSLVAAILVIVDPAEKILCLDLPD